MVDEPAASQQADGERNSAAIDENREAAEDAVLAPGPQIAVESFAGAGVPKLGRCVGPVPAPFVDVAELVRPRLEIGRVTEGFEPVP